MCRIAGIVSFNEPQFDFSLTSMLNSLAHGGPDDEGKYFDGNLAIGHRRLSIIDLSKAGHQPMLADDDHLVISFNGEIYNFLDLRMELESKGCIFSTRTDTEVILQAYLVWGVASFIKFEGIFAFSLYDKGIIKLFLVRDHVGVTPLYYSFDNNELIFASEVKAFKALRNDWPDDEDWKILFLAFGSIPHPKTTLTNVYQVPPGSYLEVQIENLDYALKFFYHTNTSKPLVVRDVDALELMHHAMVNAIKKNLVSDAPLGVFLSGGIDSSLLTLLADQQKESVKTVSVNFPDATFNELPFQKIVLEKTKHVKHTSHTVSEQSFWDNLNDIWSAMDQPSIDGVNSYFVSLCAKKEGLKVVLSGIGADEIFGGYKSTVRIKWIKKFRMLPFKEFISKLIAYKSQALKRLVFLKIPGAIGDYLFLRGIHTPGTIASILNIREANVWKALKELHLPTPSNLDDKEYVSFLESNIYMTNQLLKDTDYMSMWHGLEVRVPFLDINLIETAQTIHPSIRYNESRPKYLLTTPFKDILPVEIIFRKKTGFTFPFSLWIKNSPSRFKALLPQLAEAEGIAEEFQKGRAHWSKYWSLVVLQQFRIGKKVGLIN